MTIKQSLLALAAMAFGVGQVERPKTVYEKVRDAHTRELRTRRPVKTKRGLSRGRNYAPPRAGDKLRKKVEQHRLGMATLR